MAIITTTINKKEMETYLTYTDPGTSEVINVAYCNALIDLNTNGFNILLQVLDKTLYTNNLSSMKTQYEAFYTSVRAELVTDGYLDS